MVLLNGDCVEVLKSMADNSIDAVVTDPPYELGFMGKAWDKSGIAYRKELWVEVMRVLKPGGHLLSFGGSRTYHRMACAIEDAGFEIRDQIQYIYGSGFPKSLNIGKAVDKLQGNEREVVGKDRSGSERNCMAGDFTGGEYDLTKGTSDWEGYGTALKPAHEPIVLARKPLSEKTVAENCLKWGVGGLAIDECRVGLDGGVKKVSIEPNSGSKNSGFGCNGQLEELNKGRFPANLIHDGSDEVVELFPNTKSPKTYIRRADVVDSNINWNPKKCGSTQIGIGDSGSAARFFYCAKASKRERDMGCDGEAKQYSHDGREKPIENPYQRNKSVAKNNHPTVKPLALMKYLVKLISREGQVVLDPFMGSGTTGIACKELNREFIGIEKQAEYYEIAKARIA